MFFHYLVLRMREIYFPWSLWKNMAPLKWDEESFGCPDETFSNFKASKFVEPRS